MSKKNKQKVFVGLSPIGKQKLPTGQAGESSVRKKVFVGLSGGVDSSVSAALLKEQGFDVVGAFIKVWTPPGFPCPWREDRRDAIRVCAALKIPFVMVDLEKEYKKEIIDYMISEYKTGKTPNPDMMCNKSIKFGAFLKKAESLGADFVATGHYARIKKGKDRKLSLLRGVDQNKDQSYFLAMLNQKQLSKIIFPIGGYTKPEVRKMAVRYKLPTAMRKESQGLCFIGEIDMKDFLKEYIKTKKGKVLDESGLTIGEHDGATFLTIGQRHGFTIFDKNPSAKPHYVVKKDIKSNTVTVSDEPFQDGFARKNVSLKNVNWCAELPPAALRKNKYYCVIRYRGERIRCSVNKINSRNNTAEIAMSKPQYSITKGQFMAIYKNDECLGGGVIR